MRILGQSFCMLAISVGVSAATVACGSSDDSTSLFDGGSSSDASTHPSSSGASSGGGSGSGSGSGGTTDASLGSDTTTPVGIIIADGGSGCTPKSCTDLGYTCGQNNDGCGGVLDCGSTCPSGQYCGGGGFSKCGVGTGDDGGSEAGDDGGGGGGTCSPVTCGALGFTCGQTGDGCGGVLDCGTCATGQYCGGGGFSRCGAGGTSTTDGGAVCVPKTCSDLSYNCGAAGDGCGGSISCGTCTAPQYCGGGGFNTCGGSTGTSADGGSTVSCTPKTCASLGYNCGAAGDGCGNALSCGTCGGSDICGGAGVPGVCGNSVVCTNLCSSQVTCDASIPTTVTGVVRAGISAWTGLTPDPVPNVLVYVPNAPLDAFTPGASCRQCGADVSGSPLVSTYTDFDGSFTLSNVPTGANIPVVIQLGRWRRLFHFTVPSCASTSLGTLNLPRNQGEGNIPLTAISTGAVDALECVLLKMGLDQAEFTADSGSGRIHIYSGAPGANGGNANGGNPGATVANSRNEPALMGAGGTYMNYDQIMFPCWGAAATKTATELANLVTYSDSGGHFFATHYSYSWLANNAEFATVANWNPNFDNPGAGPWTLNVSTVVPPSPPAPHSETFVKWLNEVGALSNSGATVPSSPQVSISNPRHDADSVKNGSVDWIDGTDQGANSSTFHGNGTPLVEHFTFNTPVGATSQCGHDIFSDFHVTNASNTNGTVFPAECNKTFTPQEKILEFMIWDLASCVPPPPSPSCTPTTCQAQGIACGPAGDGCGDAIDCGQCPTGQQCGGGGVYGQCIPIPDSGSCTPQTCAQQGIACGAAGDGCGASLDCGQCTAPQTCGGGGTPGQCGGTGCTPITCAQQNITCGPAGDGCGNLLQCGSCATGQTCGGGGTSGQCGTTSTPTCTPATCAQLGVTCGPTGDGCGNLLQCGSCLTGQTCGGGGVPGQCGGIAM
jgi:hypothetical protein